MIHLLFLLIISLSQSEEVHVCENPQPQKIDSFREEQLDKFANKKEIATRADHTLETLVVAKSPIILSWISARKLDPQKDALTIAQEWRKYFALNFIINKYPFGEKNLDKEIEALFVKFTSHYFPKSLRLKFQNNFLETKRLAIAQLKSYPISQESFKEIENNINSIKLYLPGKLAGSKYQLRLLEFFEWGVAYDPISHEINVGIKELDFENEESLKSVFAHELAHSFDSCRWSAYYKGPWPFDKVGKCLREIARPRDDSKIDEFVTLKRIPNELALSLRENPTCNKSTYPPIGLQADQLPETFADWFSAEVSANFSLKNFRRDLCQDKNLNPGSSYLTNHDRLFKVFLAHPKIKAELKNSDSAAVYCSF